MDIIQLQNREKDSQGIVHKRSRLFFLEFLTSFSPLLLACKTYLPANFKQFLTISLFSLPTYFMGDPKETSVALTTKE